MGNTRKVYEKRIVAFVDILGFKSIINRLEEEPELFDIVRNILDSISKKVKEISSAEMTAFSDNIVISSNKNKEYQVLIRARDFSLLLLQNGFLCRGGVAIGPTYHKGNIVFGKGFVNAYQIEQKIAKYPRIVVSNEIAQKINIQDQWPKNIIKRDKDGCWFINLFIPPVAGSSGKKYEDIVFLTNKKPFNKIREQIVEGVKRSLETDQVDLDALTKHYWLASQFNESIRDETTQTKLGGQILPIDLDNIVSGGAG